jgi:hypothetical protein
MPALRLVRCLVAYLVGAFLIGWGYWVFGYQLLYPATAVRESEIANRALFIYAPNMFCGVIICWGVILVLTTYRRYAGGLWTYLGALVIGVSMILAALSVDSYLEKNLRGNAPFKVLITSLVACAFLFQLGCYSLVGGRIRNRRIRGQSPLNKPIQPTPR